MTIGAAMRVWDRMAQLGWQCTLVHKPYEEYEVDRWVFHGVRLIDAKVGRILRFSIHGPDRALLIANAEAYAQAIVDRHDAEHAPTEARDAQP